MGKYNIERISQQIRIGWDGENNWRPQTFDCSSLLATRPNGTVTLWILPNGESEAFPVALVADGNLRTWTPLDSELVGGGGKLQFHCQDGTDVGKSPVYRYVVEDSILTGAEHPDDTPSWAVQVVEDVTAAVAGIEDSIEEKLPGAIEDYFEEHPVTVEETDPTVPAWAKQPQKPTYTAQEVGALPVGTPIPTKTSDLTNDSGFLTSAPVTSVNGHTGAVTIAIPDSLDDLTADSTHRLVTDAEKNAWNAKYDKPSGGIPASDLASDVLPVFGDNGDGGIDSIDGSPIVAMYDDKGNRISTTYAKYSDLPTKVSDLINDSGYQTAAQVQSAIAPLQTKAITNTGGYFTTDTVEGALQEIGAELSGINTLIGSGVIT